MVLLAVANQRGNAYGVQIRNALSDAMEKDVAIGAVYTTLRRLERKGFLTSSTGDPTPVRGGRAKQFFAINGVGLKALSRAEAALVNLGGLTASGFEAR